MIKKSITAIIVISVVLAAALVFANYTNNNNFTDNSINSSNPEKQISTTSNNANASNNKSKSNTAKSQMKISPEEAKKIAQENNEVPGEIAGTPTLSKEAGKYMYIVSFFTKNGTNTGYIGVDAQTGQTEEI